jgi:uncharacterized phage-associated protein
MATCHDVANYFLVLSDDDAGDLISNLKMQKLLYYAQGFSLAILKRPLFAEPIEAWSHGPVVPSAYERFKRYGAGAIREENPDISTLTQEEREPLDEVYRVYGQYSAWKLRNMTHDEPPWKDVSFHRQEISHDALREFFANQIG